MKHLITSALPYANGPLHFGHIAGVYLPADIYTKHKKLQGSDAIHISGSDEHGVAIMQNAQKAGKSYKQYVDEWNVFHKELFDRYHIEFDFFGQTSSEYHKEETLKWFDSLNEKGLIEKRAEDQLQCQDCKNYLPDRYVEGTCYVCGYEKARGDECPNCGEWIDAVKLKKPVCKFCESTNIEVKSVDQWYLVLSKYHNEFRTWLETKKDTWRKNVFTYVDSLSKENLVDRAITRDLDWGIDVPLAEAKGKKLYVWFDAPIGYVSNTKEYFKQSGKSDDYINDWWKNDKTVITNFIGKDNIIFHGIIFPVMSMASGKVNPVSNLAANQYVNLEGKQFSKSQGWYVDTDSPVEEFGIDNIRYYLTTLIPEANDSSFTWSGLEAKVNGELANNIGNFVNRCLTFFYKNWQDGIDKASFDSFFQTEQYKILKEKMDNYQSLMDQVQIKRSLELLMNIGQDANTYFSDCAPWAQLKNDEPAARVTIAHSAVYAMVLGVLFKPFLPKLSEGVCGYFKEFLTEDLVRSIYQGDLNQLKDSLPQNLKLSTKPEGLVRKIDPVRIKELDAALKEKAVN